VSRFIVRLTSLDNTMTCRVPAGHAPPPHLIRQTAWKQTAPASRAALHQTPWRPPRQRAAHPTRRRVHHRTPPCLLQPAAQFRQPIVTARCLCQRQQLAAHLLLSPDVMLHVLLPLPRCRSAACMLKGPPQHFHFWRAALLLLLCAEGQRGRLLAAAQNLAAAELQLDRGQAADPLTAGL
jgi:hypothetical protein